MPHTKRDCLSCIMRGPNCFCHLPADALQALSTTGRHLRLGRGERLIYEGDAADTVYLVCDGQLKLTASSQDGRLLILRIAHPGDVLGLSAALRNTRSKIAAEALEPCEVKAVDRADFLAFTERFRSAAKNTALALTTEYEGAVLSARRLALSGSAAGKLAAVLIDLSEMNVSPPTEGFSMLLTHEELGSMAGLSRETVTRLLTRFRSEGLIASADGHMVLQQPTKLVAMFQ